MPKIINIKDYKLFKFLGKGNYGEVYLTTKGDNPELLATKRIDLKKKNSSKILKYLNYELLIMKELNHPNIIHLVDVIPTPNHYYVVMEYCNGGTLTDSLKKYLNIYKTPFPQEIIQYFMRQIVEGLKYIHSHKIIHRDIKLDNILLKYKNNDDLNNFNLLSSEIKIIDFGLAIKLGPDGFAHTFIGSPINMDPVILGGFNEGGKYERSEKYNEKADIWSLGTICYQMLTGDTLFKADNIKDLILKANKGDYSIPINNNLSVEIFAFINSMLQFNSDFRLSAEELSRHDFLQKNVKEFTKIDFEKLKEKISSKGEIMFNSKDINKTVCGYIKKPDENILNKNQKILSRVATESRLNLRNNKPNQYNINKEFLKTQNNFKINENSKTNDKNDFISPKKIPININKVNLMKKNREAFCSPNRSRYRMMEKIENNEDELKDLENIEQLIKNCEMKEKEMKAKEYEMKNKKENEKNFNEKKELKEWSEYINAVLDEYLSAKEYFKNNNLIKREQETYNKYIEIKNIKSNLESGNPINNIPSPITPEYIYGYSTQERNSKFQEILQKFVNDKNKLKLKIFSNKKYAMINSLKQELESDLLKLSKLNFIIQNLYNKYKNIWVPAPEYIKEYKNYKVQKRSFENSDFKLKIQIKKKDMNQKNINFIVTLKINELKRIEKEVKLNPEKNFSEEWVWTLNFKDWKNIDNNNSDNYIFSIKLEPNNLNNNLDFDISKVILGQVFSFNLLIPTLNNDKENIEINIIPILPEGKKYLAYERKNCISIKYIYPAFVGKSKITNNLPYLSLRAP